MFIVRAFRFKTGIRIDKDKRIFGEFIKHRSEIDVAVRVCEPLFAGNINEDRFILEIGGDAVDILNVVVDLLKPG